MDLWKRRAEECVCVLVYIIMSVCEMNVWDQAGLDPLNLGGGGTPY